MSTPGGSVRRGPSRAGAAPLAALLLVLVHTRALTADAAPAAIAEGCPAVATFASIDCRAAELGQSMLIASEIGSLDRRSPFIAQVARIAILDAKGVCNADTPHAHPRAIARLGGGARLLDRLRRRLILESKRSRPDPADRDAYLAVILPLIGDVRALRVGLVCPGQFENVCGDGVPQTGFAGGPNAEECDDGNNADGDGCSALCRIEPTLHDVSAFGTFTFSRESALGFCPPGGQLFDLEATTGATGAITMRWSILRDDAGCDEPPFQCPDRDESSRVLTSDEATLLRGAFHAVRVVATAPNGCSGIAIDPCLVNTFAWDDFVATDFLCHTPLVRSDEVARILAMLNGLTQ